MPKQVARDVMIGAYRQARAARSELIDEIARAERGVRALASRWNDDLPGTERARLLRIANRLEKLLLREGKR